MKPRYVLLVAAPIALLADLSHQSPTLIFAASAISLIPLAQLLGDATEDLAVYTGPRIGGLLNATLGNAAELIIAAFALQAGLLDLVKASITGSILGNLLLVMGMSLLFGGLRHGTQRFDREHAGIGATLMVLSVIALVIPAMYGQLLGVRNVGPVESFSVAVAVVMMLIYVVSLYYSLVWNAEEHLVTGVHHTHARWSRRAAALILLAATLAVAVMSEILVGQVDAVVASLGLSELFLGVVIIPLVGNVAEHLVAVESAWKNRMDLSMTISLGSSMQVALFVAPLLVFLSLLFGQPMDLIFTPLELVTLGAAAGIAALVALDGESNWLEGAMLLAVYLLTALAFLWWPA
jgi:Ca2+:H+ antiporter